MEVEPLVVRVLSALSEVPLSTVVVVHEDGEVVVRKPGSIGFAGADRRRRPVATFVASMVLPSAREVAQRIRGGLRKRSLDHELVAIRR